VRNRIFFKLFAAFLVVIAAATTVLDFTIRLAWDDSLRAEITESLTQKAELFAQRVQEIAQRYEGKLSFRYTGPWPPYNFVTIRLQLERSAVV